MRLWYDLLTGYGRQVCAGLTVTCKTTPPVTGRASLTGLGGCFVANGYFLQAVEGGGFSCYR